MPYIPIIGDVGAANCKTVLGKLLNLTDDAVLVISSGGGDEDYARAIIGGIEVAKTRGATVHTLGLGCVASAALDILMAGSPGRRIVFEFTILMTHASNVETRNKREIELINQMDVETLEHYSRVKKAQREKFLEHGDWYLSPAEAVTLGMADLVWKAGTACPVPGSHSGSLECEAAGPNSHTG